MSAYGSLGVANIASNIFNDAVANDVYMNASVSTQYLRFGVGSGNSSVLTLGTSNININNNAPYTTVVSEAWSTTNSTTGTLGNYTALSSATASTACGVPPSGNGYYGWTSGTYYKLTSPSISLSSYVNDNTNSLFLEGYLYTYCPGGKSEMARIGITQNVSLTTLTGTAVTDNYAFTEGSGSIAYANSSTSGNRLTLSGCSFTTNTYGPGALSLSSSSSYASILNTYFGSGSPKLTVTFWYYYVSQSSQTYQTLLARSTSYMHCVIRTSDSTLGYMNSGTFSSTGTVLVTRTWYHIGMRMNGTEFHMFVNGSVVYGTASGFNNDSSNALTIIGNASTTASYGAVGIIEDVNVWNGTKLDDSYIAAVYANSQNYQNILQESYSTIGWHYFRVNIDNYVASTINLRFHTPFTMTSSDVVAIGNYKIIAVPMSSYTLSVSSATGLYPVGSIVAYAGKTLPGGWLWCDGSSYNSTTYASLYSVIGSVFGTSLPNLCARFPYGAQSTVGQSSGASTVTLVETEMYAHTHPLSATYAANQGGTHTHALQATASANTSSTHTHAYALTSGQINNQTYGQHKHAVSFTTASGGAHSHSVASTQAQHTHTSLVSVQNSTINKEGTNSAAYQMFQGQYQQQGVTSGAENFSFGIAQGDAAHTHQLQFDTGFGGQHFHGVQTVTQGVQGAQHSHGYQITSLTASTTAQAMQHAHQIATTTQTAGSASAHENMPPYITVNYIIRYS